jgi:hypothetical protein
MTKRTDSEDQDLDEVIGELRDMARAEKDPDDKAKWYKLYLDAVHLKRRDQKKERGKGFDLG